MTEDGIGVVEARKPFVLPNCAHKDDQISAADALSRNFDGIIWL